MNKVRIGIIGTGSLAKHHIDAYKQNPYAEITAICDINEERAKSKSKEFNICETYTDYNDMLKSQNIDAVSVITWNNTHEPITIAALKAGKHVLCEKPPALNAAQAKNMQEEAKRSGKLLMYGFVRRFGQNTRVLKDFIINGDLGDIYYAKAGCLRRCGNPGGWFANREIAGGGPLIDLGVHIIDLSIFLMGKPRPVAVFGNTYDKLGSRANIKGRKTYKSVDYNSDCNSVEDLANALIKFENGASLFFETSWTLNIKSNNNYLELYGDRGGAKLEPELEIFGERNNYLTDIKPVTDNGSFNITQAMGEEINHFIDCIVHGTECICPAEDGVTIMKILDAIYESSRTGILVKLN